VEKRSGRLSLSLFLHHGIQLRTPAGSIDQVLQLLLASGEIIAWDDGKRLPDGIEV
jgi:hypothetical protein